MNKKDYRAGFVILHYQVLKETVACIESIIKYIDIEDYHIVVVDNGSSNGSGEILKTQYKNNHKVTVIKCSDNHGFSGGNNIGFVHAKKDLQCDFIIVLNNDTELMQTDFFKYILEEFKRSNFAALGPEIHLLDGSVCHYPTEILKLSEIESDRQRIKKLIIKNKYFLESIELTIKHVLMKIICWNKLRSKFRAKQPTMKRQENVRLHGCCLVFSPVYVQAFDGLDNRTFFYGEEDVLFVRLIRNHMLSVYQPLVKIKHHEQAATSELMKKNYKKRRYTYEQHLNTLSMLERLYDEDLNSLKDYIY